MMVAETTYVAKKLNEPYWKGFLKLSQIQK